MFIGLIFLLKITAFINNYFFTLFHFFAFPFSRILSSLICFALYFLFRLPLYYVFIFSFVIILLNIYRDFFLSASYFDGSE